MQETAPRIRTAVAALADPAAKPKAIAAELGVTTTTTLHAYASCARPRWPQALARSARLPVQS